MEVKVSFEDFDLECEVEKAVADEIHRLTGQEMQKIFSDKGISYVSLSQIIKTEVDRAVNRAIQQSLDKIDTKIMIAVEKEVEGLAKVKVAKALSAYAKLK